MTEKQQTAVEWLIDQLPIRIVNSYQKEILKTKQMERQQIEDSYKHGQNNGYMYRDGNGNIIESEQYFTDTYQNKSRE